MSLEFVVVSVNRQFPRNSQELGFFISLINGVMTTHLNHLNEEYLHKWHRLEGQFEGVVMRNICLCCEMQINRRVLIKMLK